MTTMQYRPHHSPYNVVYRLFDAPTCHPETLDNLDDEQIDDLAVEIHEKKIELLDDVGDAALVPGQGHIAYIGFDCEWVDHRAPGQQRLNCLSYQFHLVGVGGELAAVYFPPSGHVSHRLPLAGMLSDLLDEALKRGVILDFPGQVVIVGFFIRADLAMLADLVEFQQDLGNVGGKIATTRNPVEMDLVCHRREWERFDDNRIITVGTASEPSLVRVSFCDVAKHAPEKTPLSALGELLGLEKLVIPEGYSIARMDELRDGNLQSYIDYALRDAEIPAKFYLTVLEFARETIWDKQDSRSVIVPETHAERLSATSRKILPVSAGALAVQLCKKTFSASGFDFDDLFGLTHEVKAAWNSATNRLRKEEVVVQDGMREFHEAFAAKCYHGGRNECFYAGPTPPGIWHDFDLRGAYTTGMLLIRPINYAESKETRRIEDFLGDVMGFAWVEFEYPDDVCYPALPVRCEERGLIFPRSGVSYATSPEIALAHGQGVQARIRRGVVYPWKEDPAGVADRVRIFLAFVREIRRLRAMYPKGSVFEQTAKLLGNSLYGKTGQGLRGKVVFDTHGLCSQKVGHSGLTNAPIAALTTGFIRAVVGEILHRLPRHRTVISVTTDGIMTDAEIGELDLNGPLCQRYLELCALVQS